jgi:3-hydroxybutyryl-CoA dehydrogenase
VLGRKTKRGFYNYDAEMKAIVAPETPAPDVRPDSVWVSAAEPYGRTALTGLLTKIGAPLESGAKPSAKALCLVTPFGDDTTTCAVEQGLDPRRTVAVDTLFPLSKRRTIMPTPLTAMRRMACSLATACRSRCAATAPALLRSGSWR